MKHSRDKFCYLRCLDRLDRVCFVDAMIEEVVAFFSSDHEKIFVAIGSGSIPMNLGDRIMTKASSNLKNSYWLFALCTELGYPLPSQTTSLINYGVLLKSLDMPYILNSLYYLLEKPSFQYICFEVNPHRTNYTTIGLLKLECSY
jgi:hypothetical protein